MKINAISSVNRLSISVVYKVKSLTYHEDVNIQFFLNE